MDIVVDTCALLAVVVGEPERDQIIELTSGHSLIGPGSIPWEVGNAFSAMLKQKRISVEDAQQGVKIFQEIPIRYLDVNFENVLSIAHSMNMYAYDAYFLDCAIRYSSPLLTLDKALQRAGRIADITILEVK